NCSNIGVAQIVAASWSDKDSQSSFSAAESKALNASASAAAGSISAPQTGEDAVVVNVNGNGSVQVDENVYRPSFLKDDGSIAIHAGMISHHFFFCLSFSLYTELIASLVLGLCFVISSLFVF
ncbi:hypothetical protein Tco_0160191, partial [Tanacetum coccineum]